MIKLKGKILSSVLAITILSSSAVTASGFNFANIDYNRSYNNSYNNGYTVTYDYNDYNYDCNEDTTQTTEENTTKVKYPVFNWNVITNGSWGNNWVTIPPSKPEVPESKPEVPESKPEVPESKPEVPESKPEVPESKPEVPEVETPSVSGMSQIELEVVRLVNIERQKEGLAPLTTSSEFSNVARKKSEDMAVKGYFSHTSPTYGSPFEMMKSFGIKYRTAGENIAKGQTSAASVMRAWMNSSGHRANIMNPSFGKIGVGMYEKNGTKYWTQMFTD